MKRSSREKTILKLLAFVVFVGLVTEGWDRYSVMKKRLERDTQGKNDEIMAYMQELEGQDPKKYLEEVADIDEALFTARERVIELPTEAEASLIVRQAISESAENSGVTINSINVRKSKEVAEEGELRELRTYFGYDTDLEELLRFFHSFEGKSYYMVIENLSISARQRPKARPNRKTSKRRTPIPQRKPLNGNAIIKSLYLPNSDGNINQYEGGGKTFTAETPDISSDAIIDPTIQTDPMPDDGLDGLKNPMDNLDEGEVTTTASKVDRKDVKKTPKKVPDKKQDRPKIEPKKNKPKPEPKAPPEKAERDVTREEASKPDPRRTESKVEVVNPDNKATENMKPAPEKKVRPKPRRPMESKPASLTAPSRPTKN